MNAGRNRPLAATFGVMLALGLVPLTGGAAVAQSDPSYPITSLGDLVGGSIIDAQDPAMEGKEPGSGDNPHFMPDWNGNGVFGELADIELEHADEPTEAWFRYPCIDPEGTVTYRTLDDSCVPGDTAGATFRLGKIRKVSITNSRGSRLAGRLMLPEAAQGSGTSKVPGVVFSDGANFPASSFYMFGMTFARDGMIVLHYDQQGQGDSEGQMGDQYQGPASEACGRITGACHDKQDVVRWLVGDTIEPVATGDRDPAYVPEGENVPNPVLDRLDVNRVGIIGQSLGSVATTSYLRLLEEGAGSDGRPLPKPAAAVALSGFNPSSAVVPVQAQTADYDIPGTGYETEYAGTDGPIGAHAWYEKLREDGKAKGYTSPLEFLSIESGSHGDSSNVTHVPHAVWAYDLGTYYATSWFGCYLKGDQNACERSYQPREHLSRIVANEYDVDGGAGPEPSRCLTVPNQVSVANAFDPEGLLRGAAGQPKYDCTP